jgi:mono/diheme cytochrome c family protein
LADVPDYLLQRSRERRAALGGGGAAGGPTPSGGESGASEAPSASPAPVEASETPAPAAAEAPVPAIIEEAPPPRVLPESRTGIPRWMLPVLVALPFWAIVYIGAFGTTQTGAEGGAVSGAQVYATNCAVCHGARGVGGVGPALTGGDAKITFPNEADHIAWVESGSSTKRGQPYGDPNRPGGPRIAKSGGMPAFKGTLNDAQIKAVVEYERGL